MAQPSGLRAVLDADWFNKLLIVCCALTWGFSFFVMKDITAQFPVFWLLLIRFSLATVIMFLAFRKRVLANLDRRVVRTGVIMGVLYGLAYVFQTFGLTQTTPGKNAFLTGVYCVMVPFCAWALGSGRPRRIGVLAAFVSLVGMGFVVLDNGFPLNVGDLLTLVGAVLFAFQMAIVAKEGRGHDVWALTFWQFAAMTVVCAIGAFATEQPPALATFTPENIAALAFLVIACSFGTLVLLNYGLTKVDPAAGSLLSSLESPSGVAFSVAFGYEVLTPRLLLGFALIFCGIIVSEVGERIILALPGGRHRSRA